MPHVDHVLIKRAKLYCRSIFSLHRKSKFVYHDLTHTTQVVKAAKKLAGHYQLSDEDYQVVMLAAWFHDIGYFEDPDDHEEQGASIAEQFLLRQAMDPLVIDRVKQAIRATRMPQSPKSLIDQIVCDADFYHVGTNKFKERSRLMRKEYNLRHNEFVTKSDWRQGTIVMLAKHVYQTAYAQKLLNETKAKNLDRLIAKQKKKSETSL